MKYLKYFESVRVDDSVDYFAHRYISEVKQKLDYLAQNLLDDYNGEFVVCRIFRWDYKNPSDNLVKYTIDLDLDLIISDEYRNNISKIHTKLRQSGFEGNIDLSEILPYSRYDIDANNSFFDKGAYLDSYFTKNLDKSYKDENMYQSAVFKPEFLKEMLRFQKGVKHESIDMDWNYDISLHDYSSEPRGGLARLNITIQKNEKNNNI